MASAVVGAGAGAAAGGRLSDHLGRRAALAIADVLFCAGALAMAAARSVQVLILGEEAGRGQQAVMCRAAPPSSRRRLLIRAALPLSGICNAAQTGNQLPLAQPLAPALHTPLVNPPRPGPFRTDPSYPPQNTQHD